MPVTIKSTGGGSVTMSAANTASDYTLTLPASTATVATVDGSGNLSVTGNISSSGTITAATGTLYPIVSGTAVTLTNQTNVDFTGIPSWVKRITVMFSGISSNGNSNFLIQLGTSGGIVASGYLGTGMIIGASGVSTANFTTGFGFNQNSQGAGYVGHGMMTICLIGSNTWTAMGVLGESDTNRGQITGASIVLGGTLTQLRWTTVNGTDQYDAGTINILYE